MYSSDYATDRKHHYAFEVLSIGDLLLHICWMVSTWCQYKLPKFTIPASSFFKLFENPSLKLKQLILKNKEDKQDKFSKQRSSKFIGSAKHFNSSPGFQLFGSSWRTGRISFVMILSSRLINCPGRILACAR